MTSPLKWHGWLRACAKDRYSPAQLPGPLAMLTGQDVRTLEAISACWALYSCSDDEGQWGALEAVHALLPALQPKCRPFARELIAFHLDWSDRGRLWPMVSVDEE